MAFKKQFGTYPNFMVVLSITIALFLIGLCGLLAIQAKRLTQLVRENLEVQVNLEKDLSAGALDTLFQSISQKPFVAQKEDKYPQINFLSKEVAAKKFIQETKEDFKQFLGENPLRDSYMVKIREEYFEEAKLQAIQKELNQLDGVFEVTYVKNFVSDVNQNIKKLYLILAGFATLLIVIVMLLVNNTIRLAFYSQRLLIRSMQLVGATDGFIRSPFLKRGILQGLVGALIAGGLVFGVQQLAILQIPELIQLQELNKMLLLAGVLVVLGMLVGFISTYQAVQKFLRMSLDELY